MSFEEQEFDLLAAFQARFGISKPDPDAPPETGVLEDAKFVYDNAIDVSVDMQGTKAAAESIWQLMQEKTYSTKSWSEHPLNPKAKDESTVAFIFTMDVLNFCFWSDSAPEQRYAVEYDGQKWTGYWSLVAALRRALDEGIPITSSDFWQNEEECTEETLRHVFRSATDEEMPMLQERLSCLREAGQVLYERFQCSFVNCIETANKSAAALVNLVVKAFPSFRDETHWEDRKIRVYKRAQILVADLWACFDGQSFGEFHDIDKITAFADYRIPQMLHALGCIYYSPPLDGRIRRNEIIESGHNWEVQLRGCSIWAVEQIRQEIKQRDPDATVNAVLIDFFLWDSVKSRESGGEEMIPHHRTRGIRY